MDGPEPLGHSKRREAGSPTPEPEHVTLFKQQLLELGFLVEPVKGDGNCLYYSISQQLFGVVTFAPLLRKQCADYIMNNQSKFYGFMCDGETVGDYVSKVRVPNTWGDHIEAFALACIYYRPITILQLSQAPTLLCPPGAEDRPAIYISRHEGVHYNSLQKYSPSEFFQQLESSPTIQVYPESPSESSSDDDDQLQKALFLSMQCDQSTTEDEGIKETVSTVSQFVEQEATNLMASSLKEEFTSAKDNLSSLTDDPGNEAKLKLYGLFKQATVGKCEGKRPGMNDFDGRAKYDAWNALGPMTTDDAMTEYISTVSQLLKEQGVEAGTKPSKPKEDPSTFIVTRIEGKVFNIYINRPAKYNALTWDMYRSIGRALRQAAEDKTTTITVLGAAGDHFCSGNDLGNFKLTADTDIPKLAHEGRVLLQDYVGAYIDHPKALIGLINGPAVGISVTVLGLFDMIIASDKSTFHTPFSALGQTPEGCSSFTFPRIMGLSKASQFLLFGQKLTAQEAFDCGLVTKLIPDADFATESKKLIDEYSELPPMSMGFCKGLIRESTKSKLHDVNAEECKRLEERWQSEECMVALKKQILSDTTD